MVTEDFYVLGTQVASALSYLESVEDVVKVTSPLIKSPVQSTEPFAEKFTVLAAHELLVKVCDGLVNCIFEKVVEAVIVTSAVGCFVSSTDNVPVPPSSRDVAD